MSKMSELEMDVIEALQEGHHPTIVARMFDIPVMAVYNVLEAVEGRDEPQEEYSPYDTVNS